jgi:hypothetical protein
MKRSYDLKNAKSKIFFIKKLPNEEMFWFFALGLATQHTGEVTESNDVSLGYIETMNRFTSISNMLMFHSRWIFNPPYSVYHSPPG